MPGKSLPSGQFGNMPTLSKSEHTVPEVSTSKYLQSHRELFCPTFIKNYISYSFVFLCCRLVSLLPQAIQGYSILPPTPSLYLQGYGILPGRLKHGQKIDLGN